MLISGFALSCPPWSVGSIPQSSVLQSDNSNSSVFESGNVFLSSNNPSSVCLEISVSWTPPFSDVLLTSGNDNFSELFLFGSSLPWPNMFTAVLVVSFPCKQCILLKNILDEALTFFLV